MHVGHEEIDMAAPCRRSCARSVAIDAAAVEMKAAGRAAAADGQRIARVHQSASSALTMQPLACAEDEFAVAARLDVDLPLARRQAPRAAR